jgi:hypothetical protein
MTSVRGVVKFMACGHVAERDIIHADGTPVTMGYCIPCHADRGISHVAVWQHGSASMPAVHGYVAAHGFGGARTCVCGKPYEQHKVVAQ